MSLNVIVTTAIYTECEPEMATETLSSVHSEVDDKVAAVTELIITRILYAVLSESTTAAMNVDEVTIATHIENAHRRLLDTTVYSQYIEEFSATNQNINQYVPSVDELELTTLDRFVTVVDEIRRFVPKPVNIDDCIEFDEEADFEAFLKKQEQWRRAMGDSNDTL
jgi:hypothetical protein